jgi:uncharacterized protein
MRNKTINAGLFIALVMFGCAGVRAQETTQITPEKRALIKELQEVTGGTKGINQLLDVMLEQQERDLPKILAQLGPRDTKLTPKERAAMDEKVKEATLRAMARLKEVFQKLNYAQVIEDLTTSIFDKYFNESELKEWVAFYKSPLGKKTIELMPTIYAESMSKISDAVLPSLQTEMSKVITEETERLEKELKEVTVPPPATKKRG